MGLITNRELNSKDWRNNYALIMALSQLAEYVDDESTIVQFVDQMVRFLDDGNPLIRYAACHFIGRFAEDL